MEISQNPTPHSARRPESAAGRAELRSASSLPSEPQGHAHRVPTRSGSPHSLRHSGTPQHPSSANSAGPGTLSEPSEAAPKCSEIISEQFFAAPEPSAAVPEHSSAAPDGSSAISEHSGPSSDGSCATPEHSGAGPHRSSPAPEHSKPTEYPSVHPPHPGRARLSQRAGCASKRFSGALETDAPYPCRRFAIALRPARPH